MGRELLRMSRFRKRRTVNSRMSELRPLAWTVQRLVGKHMSVTFGQATAIGIAIISVQN